MIILGILGIMLAFILYASLVVASEADDILEELAKERQKELNIKS